jgi:hydrogenase maturation protease
LEPIKSVNTDFLIHSEERTRNNPKITVLGIGNLLLQDEGVGVHLVRRLNDIKLPEGVDLVDGGTSPDISSLVPSNIDKLIIVDAAKAGGEPGAVYRFRDSDLDVERHDIISLHEIGLYNGLQSMHMLNNKPKSVIIFGIEPKSVDFGLELSPEVNDQMSSIIELVLGEIEKTNMCMEVNR